MSHIQFIPCAEAHRRVGMVDLAIISITTPGQAKTSLKPGWGGVLRLEFADVDDGEHAMYRAQAAQIIQFAHQQVLLGRDIIVHCDAGISRSAAVALFLGNVFGQPVYCGALRVTQDRYSLYNRHVMRTLCRAFYPDEASYA